LRVGGERDDGEDVVEGVGADDHAGLRGFAAPVGDDDRGLAGHRPEHAAVDGAGDLSERRRAQVDGDRPGGDAGVDEPHRLGVDAGGACGGRVLVQGVGDGRAQRHLVVVEGADPAGPGGGEREPGAGGGADRGGGAVGFGAAGGDGGDGGGAGVGDVEAHPRRGVAGFGGDGEGGVGHQPAAVPA
jgi:hypothetical protein